MSSSSNSPKRSSKLNALRRKGLKTQPSEKIESQLDSALNRGEFDNLPSAGAPLSLDKNPFTRESAISTELLKNSGFSLPFVQEKKEVLTAVSQAEKKLLLVWKRYDGTDKSRQRWQDAKDVFSEKIIKINKRILTYNLKAPSVQLHIPSFRVEERIRAIQESIM